MNKYLHIEIMPATIDQALRFDYGGWCNDFISVLKHHPKTFPLVELKSGRVVKNEAFKVDPRDPPKAIMKVEY